MIAAHPTTAEFVPDPIAVCAHINRLNRELKLARRLLRIAVESRQQHDTERTHASEEPGVGDATR